MNKNEWKWTKINENEWNPLMVLVAIFWWHSYFLGRPNIISEKNRYPKSAVQCLFTNIIYKLCIPFRRKGPYCQLAKKGLCPSCTRAWGLCTGPWCPPYICSSCPAPGPPPSQRSPLDLQSTPCNRLLK